MDERRIAARQPSLVFYDLMHTGSGERFGELVDLSSSGLMAICDAPVLPGSRVSLQMDITARMLGTRSISFDAICRWCERADPQDVYACGLQVVPQSGSRAEHIPHLAATMLFDGVRAF